MGVCVCVVCVCVCVCGVWCVCVCVVYDIIPNERKENKTNPLQILFSSLS